MRGQLSSSEQEARMLEQACPGATHTWEGLPCRLVYGPPRNGPGQDSLVTIDFGGDQPRRVAARVALRRRHTPPTVDAVRRAMFNQGCPMSTGLIWEAIHQGRHGQWPPMELTQQTLDAMERMGWVRRGIPEERSYWLVPLEGWDR